MTSWRNEKKDNNNNDLTKTIASNCTILEKVWKTIGKCCNVISSHVRQYLIKCDCCLSLLCIWCENIELICVHLCHLILFAVNPSLSTSFRLVFVFRVSLHWKLSRLENIFIVCERETEKYEEWGMQWQFEDHRLLLLSQDVDVTDNVFNVSDIYVHGI